MIDKFEISALKDYLATNDESEPKIARGFLEDVILMFEEIQQYRAIGTVEEFREARERQKCKIPDIWGDGCDERGNMICDMYDCPNCGKSYEVDYHDYKYCPECGKAFDRSDLDKLV